MQELLLLYRRHLKAVLNSIFV